MPALPEPPVLFAQLTPLAEAQPDAVERLLDAAFGADRRRRTAYRLREGAIAIPELSFAAWNEGGLVGTLQSWPVALRGEGRATPLTMVGPVAVVPAAQGRGIGSALMDRLVAVAKGPLVMIGDPDYYRRWGFVADAAAGWRIEAGPYEQHRLLARGAAPNSGILTPRHSRESGNPASSCCLVE